ncbi:hypothetical protein P2M50_12900 [Mannheimia haemolytica]|nr:hypothetical protein [Mannheimia haemolytica]MDW1156116.1 hypothetical protein [Mannheimia haemolytica]
MRSKYRCLTQRQGLLQSKEDGFHHLKPLSSPFVSLDNGTLGKHTQKTKV